MSQKENAESTPKNFEPDNNTASENLGEDEIEESKEESISNSNSKKEKKVKEPLKVQPINGTPRFNKYNNK